MISASATGVYGKLHAEEPPEVVWHTQSWARRPYARWSVTVDERRDYVGVRRPPKNFVAQRWFHLIDSDKALAVAITQVPASTASTWPSC